MSTEFSESPEGQAFLASADSRETSPEIMEAIAFFAANLAEAEALWNGDGFGTVCHTIDLWEHVTQNGRREASEYYWGSAGSLWWEHLEG